MVMSTSSIQKTYRIVEFSQRFIVTFLSIITLFFTASGYAATKTVPCRGVDDTNAIQTAINNAHPSDTIELVGICQLNGTQIFINTSNLTIKGAGAEGNWSTVLSGCTVNGCTPTSTGAPAEDFPPAYKSFNIGFSIGPSNNTISNVTIQGIKFRNLEFGINISASIAGNTDFCSGTTVTNGNASGISIANNWFDNDLGAVENFGLSDHINIVGNQITNSGSGAFEDIIIQGQLLYCRPTPEVPNINIGMPSAINISNNTINNDTAGIPISVLATDALIANNNITISQSSPIYYAVIDVSTDKSLIIGNTIDGQGLAPFDIMLDWPYLPFTQPTTFLVVNNTVKNPVPTTGVGIDVNSSVSGVTMIGNFFNNISSADYLLCDANGTTNATAAADCFPNASDPVASFNNKVVSTNPKTTVMNLGNNNKIIGPYTNVP
jgi:hypothetical protein